MAESQLNIKDISEVSIGTMKMPGYNSSKNCLTINGYIDYGKAGRVLYLDCTCDEKEGNDCVFLKAILNHEHTDGEKKTKHRRGSKGQIMDDILEEFNESRHKEIKIPIKTNKEDDNTYPGNMKRGFVIFKELYETQLEPHVIEKMQRDEFVDNYVLTVRKVEDENAMKNKVMFPLKAFKKFFSPEQK